MKILENRLISHRVVAHKGHRREILKDRNKDLPGRYVGISLHTARNSKKSTENTRISRLALPIIFTLAFALAAGLTPPAQAAGNVSSFAIADKELNSARVQFHTSREDTSSSALSPDSEREIVLIDDSNLIHLPQEYVFHEPEDFLTSFADHAVEASAPYSVGDTLPFYSNYIFSSYTGYTITGKLIAQSSHVNIWVLDNNDYHTKTGTACTASCHLNDITPLLAQQTADRFDIIYNAMTDPLTGFGAHENVLIKSSSTGTAIGDISSDGKINFLLYDIMGDGGAASYTSGYFNSSDYINNKLDMLHMDIGDNQGYRVINTGSEADRLSFFGTMAHEFQHMLYYMYYGYYIPYSGYDSDSWINESLSELASVFYTDTSKELVNLSRICYAAQNPYSGSGYRDFFNHSSYKNYGMENAFACVLHILNNNVARDIYGHFAETYPPSTDSSQFSANRAKIKSMQQAVGDFLKAGVNIGSGGENSIALLYYLFMENFVADGGTIYGETAVRTTKVYSLTPPVNNLWAWRPVVGVSNGVVLISETLSGGFYPASSYTAIPSILSGVQNSISLVGYGTPNSKGASHEMLYKLTGGGAGAPYLTITVPDDGNPETRYYVAVAQDILTTGNYIYSSGRNGASLYPLTKGKPELIDTQGKGSYLFVVTLYKNVNSSVSYSWASTQGVSVKGRIKVYNTEGNATVRLLQNEQAVREFTVPSISDDEQQELDFIIKEVTPGVYTLEIIKTSHAKYVVKNLVVGDTDLDLTVNPLPDISLMELLIGDVNGDGFINAGDINLIWSSANYSRSLSQAQDKAADLNGDGIINANDLNLAWSSKNYSKGIIIIN